MSELQELSGLKPKKRFRGRSLGVQLQEALRDAESLGRVKKRDESESFISRMKLVNARVLTLRMLLSQKKQDGINKLKADNAKLTAANATLKSEVERLTAALAVKSATVSPVTAVNEALANYNANKGGDR
jgi:hypothetical protein